jgi:proteic killer suppression protein
MERPLDRELSGRVAACLLRRGCTVAAHPDLESRLFRKLQMIDDATTDQDLRVPPSNHFEKLRGNLAGLHSIRVNNRWRLVFRWDGSRGEAEDVYLDDHSYR